MNKKIKDGKVAVLYSPSYGAGWHSWNREHKECLFCPEIVDIVEREDYPKESLVVEVQNIAQKLFGEHFCCGGARDLEVEWVEEGSLFRIEEYDGYESFCYEDTFEWAMA